MRKYKDAQELKIILFMQQYDAMKLIVAYHIQHSEKYHRIQKTIRSLLKQLLGESIRDETWLL